MTSSLGLLNNSKGLKLSVSIITPISGPNSNLNQLIEQLS